MPTVISFPATDISRQELGCILSDYLALDRARILRRLLMARCGLLAAFALLLESVFRGFSPFARLGTMALCLFPLLWARIVELDCERRLSRRMAAADGGVTRESVPRSESGHARA